MLALLRNNADLVRFTEIMIYNLKYGKKQSKVGRQLDFKTDYADALKIFLINASCQLDKNVLDNLTVFRLVQDFFSKFASSDSWMEKIDFNIKEELQKQNKTTRKVG